MYFSNTMNLTIDRSKWLSGEGNEDSFLLRASDGKMCCLGFLGLACGYSEKDIRNVQTPVNVFYDDVEKRVFGQNKFPDDLALEYDEGKFTQTLVCGDLMETNDLTFEEAVEQTIDAEDDGSIDYQCSLIPEQFRANKEKEIARLFQKIGITVEFTGEYTVEFTGEYTVKATGDYQ